MFDVPWSGGNEVLLATLDEIGMPSRIVGFMANEGVVLVGTFVQMYEPQVMRRVGIGRGSLRRATETLERFGYHLGMSLRGWDEELALEARRALGRRLYQRIFEISPTHWEPHSTLEAELTALLREVEGERNVEMLNVFYGFNDRGPTTLEYAGLPYGLTRERVRQIASRVEKKLEVTWRPLDCLRRAKAILASDMESPFTNEEFLKALRAAKLSQGDFHVDGFIRALDLVGEAHAIESSRLGDVTLYGSAEDITVPRQLLSTLRKETSANGCTNLQRLLLITGLELDQASRVRELLELFPEVLWLDHGQTWLLSTKPTRNRIVNISSRVFSISKAVEINELRNALRRHVRVNYVPPPEALGNLLEHYQIARMTKGIAEAQEGLQPSELGINDQGLVDAFERLGNPLTREQLEDYCLDELGMNINSFYVYLSYSPLITKLAAGVFSLVGRDVAPGAIDQLRAEIRDSRFEDSFGWSKVGTLWWHFQADRPTAKAGTRALPAFVFNLTSGTWKVRTIDGLDFGTAKIENGFMSGFGLAFAALGVSNKDFLQLDFEIAKKQVFARVVGDEPEEIGTSVEEDEFDQEAALEEEL